MRSREEKSFRAKGRVSELGVGLGRGGVEGGRGCTYFCGFVFGGGDEVGAVGGHLHVCDLHAVFVAFNCHFGVVGEFALYI